MSDAIRAETIRITGADGDEIEAYFAQPEGRGKVGSIVVIHHLPGYDAGTKEITRTFAVNGYLAICPNQYWREAPGIAPDDAAAIARSKGGVPDARLIGDVAGAIAFLKAQPDSNGKVATIGYCSGGRQSFLAACSLQLDAAIDCYGACVVEEPPPDAPIGGGSLLGIADNLSCPLLGLFGADDSRPSPEATATLAEVLSKANKDFEFHTFDGAGHAFFATDRPSYRLEAAQEGWQFIWRFLGAHLSA